MRLTSFLWTGLMVAVFAAGCEQGGRTGDGGGGPIRVGATAPDFSLPAASGGEISLSDYRDSPVLLYFSMGPG
jgi:cytochrome oxidase Cu insertion factor (SCO1/SenC/PrrC family)